MTSANPLPAWLTEHMPLIESLYQTSEAFCDALTRADREQFSPASAEGLQQAREQLAEVTAELTCCAPPPGLDVAEHYRRMIDAFTRGEHAATPDEYLQAYAEAFREREALTASVARVTRIC